MNDHKQQLRKQMKSQLHLLDDHTYDQLSSRIVHRLMEQPFWQKAKTIATTMSRQREINTKPLIEKAWENGKSVAVPKADPQTKTMDFREIKSFRDVESAYAGIHEPILATTKPVFQDDIDLLIVPGLLFDKEGYRIGFGGGFYDRYLIKYRHISVSLALNMQLVENVPKESFDRPVAFIITEKRVIQTSRYRK